MPHVTQKKNSKWISWLCTKPLPTNLALSLIGLFNYVKPKLVGFLSWRQKLMFRYCLCEWKILIDSRLLFKVALRSSQNLQYRHVIVLHVASMFLGKTRSCGKISKVIPKQYTSERTQRTESHPSLIIPHIGTSLAIQTF